MTTASPLSLPHWSVLVWSLLTGPAIINSRSFGTCNSFICCSPVAPAVSARDPACATLWYLTLLGQLRSCWPAALQYPACFVMTISLHIYVSPPPLSRKYTIPCNFKSRACHCGLAYPTYSVMSNSLCFPFQFQTCGL